MSLFLFPESIKAHPSWHKFIQLTWQFYIRKEIQRLSLIFLLIAKYSKGILWALPQVSIVAKQIDKDF